MLDYLLQQYQWLMESTKSNPIMGGAIFATVGGAIFMIAKTHARNALLGIYDFIWRSITMTTTYTRGAGNHYDDDCYFLFMRWFSKSKYFKYCKTFIPLMTWFDGKIQATTGAGFGRHWFIHNGKLGWFTHSRIKEAQKIIDVITVTVLFGSSATIQDLMQETFHYETNELREDRVLIYSTPRDGEWIRRGAIRKRLLSSLVYHNDVHLAVLEKIKQFKADEDWYLHHGIPYKLCIVLEGPPGTGKTSMVRAIASELNAGLAGISLDSHTDASLLNAVAAAPSDAILYIEDFDSDPSTAKRSGISTLMVDDGLISDESPAPALAETTSPPQSIWGVSLSGLLNCLDGILTPHGMVVIMTTNRINSIDPALVRPGRVDCVIHVGYLDNAAIHNYIQAKFPDYPKGKYEHLLFDQIPGAKLQDYLLLNRNNPEGFVAAIPTKTKLESVRA